MAKNLYDEKSIEEASLQDGQAADNNDREVDQDEFQRENGEAASRYDEGQRDNEERMRETASQYDNEKYQYQKSRNGGESASGYNIEQQAGHRD